MKGYSIRGRLAALACALLMCSPLSALSEQTATAAEAQPAAASVEAQPAAASVEAQPAAASVEAQPVSDASSVGGTQQEEAVKQFKVKLMPGEETLEIQITGASERSIMVGVYDSGLQHAAGDMVKGNDTLTYDLAAGDYYVLVEYDPPVDGIDFYEGEVTVPAKAAPAPDNSETTAPDSSETTAPDSGETTAPDSGETTEPDSDETTEPDSGETTAPDSGETTAPDSGETTAPDNSETTAPDSGETTAPDSSETAAPQDPTPFTIKLTGGKGTLDIAIKGASDHILMIGVYDANLQNVKSGFVTGSQTVSYSGLAAGEYYVMVEYDPPVDSIGVKDGYVTVKAAADAPKPDDSTTAPPTGGTIIEVPIIPDTSVDPVDPDIPTQYRNQIEATVKAGKDSISVQIVKGDDLPMIVSVGNQTADAKLGQTVEFKNLAKGTYEIEVDYKDAVPGTSPYRTSVKVPLEKPDSYILLKKGMNCQEVYLLTQRLALLGYPITARYEYDNDVVTAVRLFQEENSLSVDGMAGKNTQKKLYSSSAKDYDIETDFETLDRHDNGKAAVYALQQRLKDLGYYTIRVDGLYGSGTERAVRWFQSHNGLKETGKADADTQKLLYSVSAKKASGSYVPDSGDYSTLSRSKYYNSKVVPLQRRLKELGYLSGSVDGYFGSQTYRAVRNFQSRNGLSVTGKADAATQALLYSSSAKAASGASASTSTGYRLLYWGCEGEAVTRLQNALMNAGYKSLVRVADGVYGQWTYDAVRAYQKDHGLSVDGIAGRNTQNALYGTSY